jgi:GNAT superfamily N-acetyltransferase
VLDPWWSRYREDPLPGGPARQTLTAVLSPSFPAGTVVDQLDDRRPTGWQVAVRSGPDGDPVDGVHVALPAAPLLWYVELPEPDEAATTLVAFSDDRYADGVLLGADQARAAGIDGGRQVAAVRWWTASGLVHQVYVGPAFRRRGVAGKLVLAAFGVQAARGLPPVHGDGRRTELGEQWREGLPAAVAARMAPWREKVRPMTPVG